MPSRYYADRRTDRNLSNPHSLVFSVLAELGLVGLLCLIAFVGALGAAVAESWRGASVSAQRHASALLAAGVVGLGQATVDWTWLIPGVTGLSILALGLGVACLRRSAQAPTVRPGSLARIVPAVALSALVAMVGLVYLADVNLRHARAERWPAAARCRAHGAAAQSLVGAGALPRGRGAGGARPAR